jgi:alpha-galactosidase
MLARTSLAISIALFVGIVLVAALAQSPPSPDISGTWVASTETPMGKIEVVWVLNVTDGKITGTQTLPFGDAPIVDGHVFGNSFELVVETEMFGSVTRLTTTGTIDGDVLHITPAMPPPPPGMAPPAGGTPGAAPPPGAGPPPRPGGAGGFLSEPLVAHRGTPTPSLRATAVDYKSLPKFDLPVLKTLPPNGLAKTPPMGWNSWNKFHADIDDKTVRLAADALVTSGMRDAGYAYVVIDDGWQGSRDAQGVLQPNAKFPDMKALSDYVHRKGLKLGIYSSPGPRTCGGFEGSYGNEAIDARTWASWGIDYLKFDWCSASRIWKDTDMPAVYQRMGEALRDAGRPIVFSLCQYGRANVQEWGPRAGGNLWRTTGDIFDRYESMASIGFSQAPLAPFAGPGHWNDPDMLEVGNGGMTANEYRTHFSLWALLAAPLMAGNDLQGMSTETASILLNKEVIAVDQDPLGRAATRVAASDGREVWAKPLASGAVAVGLFNRGNADADVTVRWSDVAIPAPRRIRDLWAHRDLTAISDSHTTRVPSHGVVLLLVAP